MRTLFFSCVLGLVAVSAAAQVSVVASKADPWVLERVGGQGETEFLVVLAEQADLSGAEAIEERVERVAWVAERLRETAARTQPAVIAELERLGAEPRPFWVANMILARGDAEVVAAVAVRSDVGRIAANPTVSLDPVSHDLELRAPTAVEWGVQRVEAEAMWAAGFRGEGVVVAGQDTGYDWDHPALVASYRGWNGATADHDYNWFDAITSGGGICGPSSDEPCDDGSHGTHTMGTIVGDDGGSNQIGVAPGARWIGCRNMNQGNGTPATYSTCFQFFLSPTDRDGQNPDPSMAPHVINNSWSCPPSEGCTDPAVLQTVVENVRAAGILVVVSAGNSGSGCSTVSTPAAIYEASFTVGSTTSSGAISGFSSRGPVTVDGSNRMKPDISAPGSSVRSSVPNGGYATFSGTSMAGPHVAGVAALVMSASPGLIGDPDAIEAHLRSSSEPKTTSQGCGGDAPDDVPNNTFGWGETRATMPLLFVDGFESGDTTAWSATSSP